MTIGVKGNVDGSGAIQVGGTDAIQISSAQAVTIPQSLAVTGAQTVGGTLAVTGNSTLTGNLTLTGNASGVIKSGTAVASTSGTSIDFTGIPSTAKRITVMFNGVSTNGTSKPMLQIGAGSITSSGYAGSSSNSVTSTGFSSGFVWCENATAADTRSGAIILTNLTTNTWVAIGTTGSTQSIVIPTTLFGTVALSGTLDRVRITTVNGTDTFDAGTINILWE